LIVEIDSEEENNECIQEKNEEIIVEKTPNILLWRKMNKEQG
jgi:hypothetical protein